MTRDLFPDDWDGERALAVADFLVDLANEIHRVYDGAIRIYYRDCEAAHRALAPDPIERPPVRDDSDDNDPSF
jgi:hypothetical protein